jgi:hypothetical protein
MLSSGSKIKTLYPNRLNHLQVQENHHRRNNQNSMYPYRFRPRIIKTKIKMKRK